MDETLHKAVRYLLRDLEKERLVDDLVLIELNWTEDVPPFTDGADKIAFQGANWPVVFTDSELVLRRTLCKAKDGKAILIVPAGDVVDIPRDIQARAARHRVAPLGLRYRLYALTGRGWPAEVDYNGWRVSIERHFDNLVGTEDPARLTRLDVTRSELDRKLVKVAFGLTVESQEAPQLLVDLVAHQGKSDRPPLDLERSLLQGQLREHEVSDAEVLLWAAKEVGQARELVRSGIIMGAEQHAGLMPNWGRLNQLRGLLVNERRLSDEEARTRVIELATETLPQLHPSTRKAVVKDAERELENILPEGSYNPWFPNILEREIERVAERLSHHDKDALERIGQLQAHLYADAHEAALGALEEMVRLLRDWGEERTRVESLITVAEWARWYTEEGAKLDLTALRLMSWQRHATGIGDPIGRLLEGYWRWRDGLNATFGSTLVSNYEAAIHDRDAGVFGIHRILDWTVKNQKKLLLLVIDGMGWPAFWHLLREWAKASPPIYIREPQSALALLPSVTSVSRKGLFLGAMPTDRLDDEEEYEKKARTSEEKALGQAYDGRVAFYNKSNLEGGEQVLSDIDFHAADLVAVILNAIDDEIKSTTTTARLPQLADLAPLSNVVAKALAARWDVLVTADHGHTWHRSKSLRQGPNVSGGGERFTPLSAGEKTTKKAVVTDDPNIVRLQEGQRVALLTAVGAYYGRIPRRGYHGGAGLEEVIVPLVYLTHQETSFHAEQTEVGKESVAGEAARVEEVAPTTRDHLGRLILTLPESRTVSLDLPFTPSPREVRLLQTLARYEQVSEAHLKESLGTRRVSGLLAMLRERLANEGLDYIEEVGFGPEGAVYKFKTEMLPD
jgi:hypothetical protein